MAEHSEEELIKQWGEYTKGKINFMDFPLEIREMIYQFVIPQYATFRLRNNFEAVCIPNEPRGACLMFTSKSIMDEFWNVGQRGQTTEIHVVYKGPPGRKEPTAISEARIREINVVQVVISFYLHDESSTVETLSADPKMQIPEPNQELWQKLISSVTEFRIRLDQPESETDKEYFNDKTLSPEEVTKAWIKAARPYVELFGRLFEENKNLLIKVNYPKKAIEAKQLVQECFSTKYEFVEFGE